MGDTLDPPSGGSGRSVVQPPRSAATSDLPPHPLDSEWHIHVNGQTYGPYAGHRIDEFVKEGRVDGATQVLPIGGENWTPASQEPLPFVSIQTQQASFSSTDQCSGGCNRRSRCQSNESRISCR
ncbi:DUF4339 domain-containing protein [Bradyrhizobium diazoefficiens]|nr:DUF4339 domain-containing protein [Bradyrhizobium diazoefficiens]